jgi:hypothetical protein
VPLDLGCPALARLVWRTLAGPEFAPDPPVRIGRSRSGGNSQLQREALIDPAGDATGHDLRREAKTSKLRGRTRRAVAMRPRAVRDEQRVTGVGVHAGGDNLSVRQIDRSGHMARFELRRPTHIQQDKPRVGTAHRFMCVPAIGLECKL